MAKQIYIDENGNELLVSGTINTADMLPYDNNTSTKDKIDEKQDSLTYETDDYSVATYGGVIRCKKWGRLVNIQGFGIGSTSALPSNAATTLCTIASKYRPNPQQHIAGINSASGYKYDGTQFYRINTDGTVVTYAYSSPTINNGYFNATYIV